MSELTYGDIVRSVSDFLNDDSPQTLSIIRGKVNQQYLRISKLRPWPEMQTIDESITYTADSAYLAMPHDCAQVVKIIDQTNDYVLRRREIGQMLEDNVSEFDQSNAIVVEYSDLGYRATRVPLSAADEVSIVANNVADSSVDVQILGMRNSPNIEDEETLTTHATAPQSNTISGSVTWKKDWSISSISTPSELTDYITIHEQATSGNVLAYLTKRRRYSKYLVLRLMNPPSAADTVTVVYKRRVLPLKDDDDVPVIDQSEAIIEATIASMRRYDEQYSQAREHDAVANQIIAAELAENTLQAPESVRSRPYSRYKYRPHGFH